MSWASDKARETSDDVFKTDMRMTVPDAIERAIRETPEKAADLVESFTPDSSIDSVRAAAIRKLGEP